MKNEKYKKEKSEIYLFYTKSEMAQLSVNVIAAVWDLKKEWKYEKNDIMKGV